MTPKRPSPSPSPVPQPSRTPVLSRLSHPRFKLFLLVFGVIAVAGMVKTNRPDLALVLGFDAGALAFLGATLPLWFEEGPEALRRRALRDDGGRTFLLVTSVAALLAVFAAMFALVASSGAVTAGVMGQVVGTLMLAWLFVNTIYAHHYGHLYYDPSDDAEGAADSGGLTFPGTEAPVFSDFCYFSFVVGMTSQVSDVTIRSRRMRKAVLLHGVMAFVFNLGVMAMTINVLASASGVQPAPDCACGP